MNKLLTLFLLLFFNYGYSQLNFKNAPFSTSKEHVKVGQNKFSWVVGKITIRNKSTLQTKSEIEEGKLGDIYKVYPNPSSDIINITYPSVQEKESIFYFSDLVGNILIIAQTQHNSNSLQLDITKYPTGVYILRIISEGKLIKNEKMIKI